MSFISSFSKNGIQIFVREANSIEGGNYLVYETLESPHQ